MIDTPTRLDRRRFLRIAGLGLTLPVVGALAACRGGGSSKTKTVKMTSEMKFEPASLTIKVGDTVKWTNDGDMVHTATADASKVRDAALVELPAGAEAWDSGNVTKGQSWSHTFQTPGRYRYVCIPHEIVGMVGEIIVGA